MKKIILPIVLLVLFASCSDDNTAYLNYESAPQDPEVVAEFLDNLSELNLYSGDLNNLLASEKAFVYELNTPLFSDYAHKQRLLALPTGTSMTYIDDGFPSFPDNTVISKTFFYNNDERNLSMGKRIVETRVLIKKNGAWELGNYIWNDEQTDAILDVSSTTTDVPISYIDSDGTNIDISYVIPSSQQCFDCHNNANIVTPIGPKLRALNFNNQLENLISSNYLMNLDDPTLVTVLPNWKDETNYTLEERARAYFDVNCAHCHSDGGFCQFQSPLRLTYETPFNDSSIYNNRFSINARMENYIPNFSMPLIGTTLIHSEGYTLVRDYINSL
jgi:uncharacterized repeat protein (TIGR03806 family)